MLASRASPRPSSEKIARAAATSSRVAGFAEDREPQVGLGAREVVHAGRGRGRERGAEPLQEGHARGHGLVAASFGPEEIELRAALEVREIQGEVVAAPEGVFHADGDPFQVEVGSSRSSSSGRS